MDEADGDLAEWARMALSHEWSTDILDVEIVGERDRHGDMLRLMEVALLCAAVESIRHSACTSPIAESIRNISFYVVYMESWR